MIDGGNPRRWRIGSRWFGLRRVSTQLEALDWLEWAAEYGHQAGCQCRGCLRSRDILAGRDPVAPQPGSDLVQSDSCLFPDAK